MAEDATVTFLQTVSALTDEYRELCLWFLRDDYYPQTLMEASRVLNYIERHGDVAAFQKAAPLRQWLSQHSSAPFAG